MSSRAWRVRLLRRLVSLAATALLVTVITFVVLRVLPGDPARLIVGTEGDPAAVERIRALLGYDRPLPVQLLDWLGAAARGDLGTSLRYDRPVAELIAGRLDVTLALTAGATLLAVLASGPLGIYAATRRGRASDAVAVVFSQVGLSLPSFWVGMLLILLFAVRLRWLPAAGYVPWDQDPIAWTRSLLLPTLALALPQTAVLTRQVRSSVLDVLGQDYIRFARAKGLGERVVLYRHALRNALIPPLTVLGLQVGQLLAGSIVVETVFALPGLGQLLLNAIAARDLPVVQGAVALAAVAVVLVNFLVDAVYALIDPRVRS
ncbi:MAG TPA: ABC transporter permease [Bacillota bacterium]